MCTPAIGIALTVASTGLSMYGKMQAQDAASAQARYQAAVQRAQADSMQEQALHTIKNAEKLTDSIEGSFEEGQRVKTDILRRAEFSKRAFKQDVAGRGVFVDSQSVIDELDLIGEFARGDAERAYDNYERQALGFAQQQDDLYFAAEQQLKGANQSLMNAGYYDSVAGFDNTLGLLGTAIGGAAAVTGQVFDYKQAGYFGGLGDKSAAAGVPSAMSGSYKGIDPAAVNYFGNFKAWGT